MQRRFSEYPKHTVLRQILKTVLTFYLKDCFKFAVYLLSKKVYRLLYQKRFINSVFSKLFMGFLHYVITMPAFQADTVASIIIVQSRKFIYQTLHETKILYKLHKQKRGKCSFVQSSDNETVKRQSDHQNQLWHFSSDNKMYKL